MLSYSGRLILDESENKQLLKTEINTKEDILKLEKLEKPDKLTYGLDIK